MKCNNRGRGFKILTALKGVTVREVTTIKYQPVQKPNLNGGFIRTVPGVKDAHRFYYATGRLMIIVLRK